MTIYKYKNCDYIFEKLYLNFKEGKVEKGNVQNIETIRKQISGKNYP